MAYQFGQWLAPLPNKTVDELLGRYNATNLQLTQTAVQITLCNAADNLDKWVDKWL